MSWSMVIEPLAAALQAQANLLPALEASTMRLRMHNDVLEHNLKRGPKFHNYRTGEER